MIPFKEENTYICETIIFTMILTHLHLSKSLNLVMLTSY